MGKSWSRDTHPGRNPRHGLSDEQVLLLRKKWIEGASYKCLRFHQGFTVGRTQLYELLHDITYGWVPYPGYGERKVQYGHCIH